MTNIVPFNKENMPAHVGSGRFNTEPTLVVPGGFPVLSIKGKVFHVKQGDDLTLIEREVDGEMIAAPSIEIVVIDANPCISKTYYEEQYEEGEDQKPDCYSENGIEPEADSENPQSRKCATCPQNQWGSRITDQGTKAKACADVRRLAVCNPDELDEPMLLRVPPTSLRPLGDYQLKLSKHNVALQEVVTRVGFDPSLAYPSLVFKPVGFIDDSDTLDKIEKAMESPVVKQILGLMPVETEEAETPSRDNLLEDDDDDLFADGEEEAEPPAPAPAKKKAAPKKKAAAKKAPAKKQAMKKPTPKVEKPAKEEDNGMSDDILSEAQEALDGFDDFDGFDGFDD